MLVCGDRARRRAAAIDVVRRRACCAHLAPTLVVRPLRCPGGNLAKLAVCKTLAICFSARQPEATAGQPSPRLS